MNSALDRSGGSSEPGTHRQARPWGLTSGHPCWVSAGPSLPRSPPSLGELRALPPAAPVGGVLCTPSTVTVLPASAPHGHCPGARIHGQHPGLLGKSTPTVCQLPPAPSLTTSGWFRQDSPGKPHCPLCLVWRLTGGRGELLHGPFQTDTARATLAPEGTRGSSPLKVAPAGLDKAVLHGPQSPRPRLGPVPIQELPLGSHLPWWDPLSTWGAGRGECRVGRKAQGQGSPARGVGKGQSPVPGKPQLWHPALQTSRLGPTRCGSGRPPPGLVSTALVGLTPPFLFASFRPEEEG